MMAYEKLQYITCETDIARLLIAFHRISSKIQFKPVGVSVSFPGQHNYCLLISICIFFIELYWR